jgi:hypothetical protein
MKIILIIQLRDSIPTENILMISYAFIYRGVDIVCLQTIPQDLMTPRQAVLTNGYQFHYGKMYTYSVLLVNLFNNIYNTRTTIVIVL